MGPVAAAIALASFLVFFAEGDVPLRGVVTVADPARGGFETCIASGTLDLRVFTREGELRVMTIPVEHGEYKARVPAGSRVAIGGLVLADRWADPVTRGFSALPENGVFDVRARWADSMVLRVVDAESGKDLREVRIVLSRSIDLAAGFSKPEGDPSHVIADEADSPLRVSSFADVAAPHRLISFQVSAPGYARKSVPVTGQPGESIVALVPVAGLEVEIENDWSDFGAAGPNRRLTWLRHPRTRPALQPVLSLRRRVAHGSPILVETRIPVPGATETYPSLEPGEYEIEVAIGPESERPIVLASAALSLVKGRLGEVKLKLADPPETATLRGEVVVPDSWIGDVFHAEVEALDVPGLERGRGVPVLNEDHARREGAAHLRNFETDWILPGRYVVTALPFGVEREVTVGAAESESVRLGVNRPCVVRLRVIAADTGEPIAAARVAWAPPAADPDFSPRPARADASDPGSFTFTCPSGDALVRIEGDEYAGQVRLADLPAGVVDRVISLPRASGFVLAVEDGVFPAGTIRDALDVRALDGGEPAALLSAERIGETERLRCVVTRPGRYRVAFRPIPYYRDVPAFEVDLAAGQFVERVIPLVEAE